MSHHVLNNTFYSNKRDQIKINRSNAKFKTLDIRNNILNSTSNTTCLSDALNAITGHSNNLYYREESSGSLVNISGKAYYSNSINNWESSTEIGLPNFKNISENEFSLSEGSLAIDNGTNLNGIFKGGLIPESTWPNNVKTMEWGDDSWEIGAFVFGKSNSSVLLPPKNLRITEISN
jgi:hypothetical protein